MAIIDINNLSFRYDKKFIFDNFNLSIDKGSWVTIAGPNGAGKSTLVSLLAGLNKNYNSIKIFDKKLCNKNMKDIRKKIGFVFDTPEDYFVCETVEDELAFSLENMAVQPATIKKKLNEITSLLKMKNLLKENPMELSGGEKAKVALGCALMLEPRMLILDEAFMMIDINERKNILDILKKYNKEKRITIVSFTHSIEEMMYSDRLIVINEGSIIIDGPFPYVFEEERVMRKVGIEVPFVIELVQKLKLFNVIDGFPMTLEGVVSELWK